MADQYLPPYAVAAAAIIGASHLFKDHSEPYRATAYALGWKWADGSAWWNLVMFEIG